jgi:AcrR family transcriptional regulator
LTNLKNFPLRDRKKANTRIAILDSVINRLHNQPLDKITIEEICDDVEISKGTFFQYFPQKTDVLVFYGLLWNLEAMWLTTKSPNVSPGISAIELAFDEHSKKVANHPQLWMEIIATRAQQPHKFAQMGSNPTDKISTVERIIRFPNLKGIEDIPEDNFRRLFTLNLQAAKENGELPANLDVEMVCMSLACIFYGVPLMTFDKQNINYREEYRKQLRVLWNGLKKE